MKNKISIKTLANKRVQTEIITSDGVSCTELHNVGLYESKVLKKILERDHYQHFKGSWTISFDNDGWEVTYPTIKGAFDAADIHIFQRDNSINYGDIS